jgi:hypothetical protein
MPGRLAIDTLKSNLQNPARAYLWEMVIPTIPGSGNVDALRTRCETSSIPGHSNPNIHIPYKGTGGFEVPGRLTFPHAITLSFLEGEDGAIFQAIYNWRNLITGVTSGVGVPDMTLKADIYLKLITKADTDWMSIKLVGAYPNDRADVALNYGADEVIRIPVTFSYDFWVPESSTLGLTANVGVRIGPFNAGIGT